MSSGRDCNYSPDPDPYCAAPSLIGSLGNALRVAHDVAGRRSAIMTAEAAAVLQAYRAFRPLEPRHAAQLDPGPASAPPIGRCDDVIRDVRGLVENGWLLSRREFLQRLMAGGGSEAGRPRISTVGVVTKNRPQCLARFLDGLLANRRSSGRTYQVVVLDASTGAPGDDTRSHAARLAAEYGAPVRYASRGEKLDFIEQLAVRCGMERSLLDFALLGPAGIDRATGANLNCLLLQTAGEITACFDDDIVCRAADVPGARPELVFSAETDPTEFHFCESVAAATALPSWDDRDVVGLHERALGRSVRDLAAEYFPDRIRCESLTLRLLQSSASGGGRVAATSLGIAGDSGMWSPQSLLLKRGVSRQRLLASDDAYHAARSSRAVVRGAPALCVTGGGALMAGAIGIDNRFPLVPFMPVLRNMDGVFAICMPLCSEHAYFAYLPALVIHEPPHVSRYDPDAVWRDAGVVRVSDVTAACVMSAPLPAGTGSDEDRLMAVGRHVESLGLMQPRIFEEFFRFHAVNTQYARLRSLGQALDASGSGPVQWKSDVGRQVEEIRRSLDGAALTVPVDLVQAGCPAERALHVAQESVLAFGRLLQAWPQLVRAALELKSEGIGLARPCTGAPEPHRMTV